MMKSYAGPKFNIRYSQLEQGNMVLLKNDHNSKRFPQYDPCLYEEESKKRIYGHWKERFQLNYFDNLVLCEEIVFVLPCFYQLVY